MAEKNFKDALKTMWDGLKEVAGDLTTLEVITFSGNIKLVLDSKTTTDPTKKTFNLKSKDALLDMIANPPEGTSVDIHVVAYTRIDFDQDAVNFVGQALTEDDQKAYSLHVDSVKASQEARSAFIDMLAGVFKL